MVEFYFVMDADVARECFPHLANKIPKEWDMAIIKIEI